LFVGNLDYIFDQAQGQFPYDVWIKVRNGADPSAVAPQVRALGQQGYADDVHSIIEEQLNRPERQGLFGVLTIGFLAAAIFTALGFALYAVFSFRQRYIELGVLRAIGLSTVQMSVFVGWELVLVLVSGAVGGTALGIAASQVYIPFLQANDLERAMPFQVIVNWPEIGVIFLLFGVLFALVLVGLVLFLRRLRIFQAVKLGE
jgi:putative ABC transport system permease protein